MSVRRYARSLAACGMIAAVPCIALADVQPGTEPSTAPVGSARSANTQAAPTLAQRISNAITELDVSEAHHLLESAEADSLALGFERARLAIYTADCDGASAILSGAAFGSAPEALVLSDLAKSCAKATAGSVVISDAKQGLWIRLQDDADRALVPFIFDVAVRARASMARDFGVVLPRPLRIDLVRDLFSLSAVSGLPLQAAETTGTVAVARWGRVTMLSPRATPLGYQWQDTLAHEITHLALSRATRDRAPLWLQEGMAKREEIRWRAPRPFDDSPAADAVAHAALLSGQAVGLDKLGASIAMLPTAEAASVAFAEVTSFMSFLIHESGDAGLRLLLADLKGLASDNPNEALRSVTGYELPAWMRRWQDHLRTERGTSLKIANSDQPRAPAHANSMAELARRVRVGDLLLGTRHAEAAAREFEPAVALAPGEVSLRYRAAKALLVAGQIEHAKVALGGESEIHSLHGGWFALHGRFLKEAGEAALAARAFELGISADPLLEEVACQGQLRGEEGGSGVIKGTANVSLEPKLEELCRAARAVPRD